MNYEQDRDMTQGLTQYVDTLFNNMKSFSQMDGLIGKPVVQGDKTFMPVISVTVGYGGGDTQTKANNNTGNTASNKGRMLSDAMGIGAKLCTDAIIVIDKDNVLVAPMGAKGGMAQMIEKIPQIVGSMTSGGQQQQQQQQQQKNQTT